MCVQCRRPGLFFIQLALWVVPYVVAAVGIGLSHVCTCLAGSPPPQCADGAFSHSCSLKLGAVAAISIVLAVPKCEALPVWQLCDSPKKCASQRKEVGISGGLSHCTPLRLS